LPNKIYIERRKGRAPIEVTRQPNDIFPSRPKLVMSCDPHLRSMACAWIDYDTEELVHVETLKYTDPKTHWTVVAREWAHLPDLPDHMTNTFAVVVEFPDHIKPLGLTSNWSKNSSKAVSNKQVSDLCKVALSIGYLCAGIKQSTGLQPILVEPREWKGRKSKDQTEGEVFPVAQEFLKKRAKHPLTEHEIDSIGICLWLIKQDKINRKIEEAKDEARR
jgi:hypothetical protein